MERIRVGGRVYTDPDVLSLIRAQSVDPHSEVVRKAQELNQRLRNFGATTEPRRRLEMLASLAGLKVAQMSGPGLGKGKREALIYRIQTVAVRFTTIRPSQKAVSISR
jgi:hypothetical protein